MSDYKRFTEKLSNGFYKVKCNEKCERFKDSQEVFCAVYEDCNVAAVEYLAKLEDKIENGTLYDFKFKVGQKVYIVCDWDIDKVVNGTVSEVELTTNKNGYSHRIYVDHNYIFSKENPNVVKYRYIFFENELFLTKAEAEKKLKALKGEK